MTRHTQIIEKTTPFNANTMVETVEVGHDMHAYRVTISWQAVNPEGTTVQPPEPEMFEGLASTVDLPKLQAGFPLKDHKSFYLSQDVQDGVQKYGNSFLSAIEGDRELTFSHKTFSCLEQNPGSESNLLRRGMTGENVGPMVFHYLDGVAMPVPIFIPPEMYVFNDPHAIEDAYLALSARDDVKFYRYPTYDLIDNRVATDLDEATDPDKQRFIWPVWHPDTAQFNRMLDICQRQKADIYRTIPTILFEENYFGLGVPSFTLK
ncbi:hypothetical protein ACFOY8_14715 [Thalassospira xianhensis]|uniref:Uncharacterized protein n=1 Tax=Thalassospira xianhensis MCCC 1A02616 TaxID=1177929 RepID=A0A367UHB3_9PROT|nr:hypothetical protein [Thalassospira xianhensis]RCK07598.1 hypothetical protein TH5_00520 [Thalassospira xianhensis MCCC 1A02616]